MARDRLLSQFASGIATIPINTDYTNRVLTIGSTITLSPNGQISASGVSTFSNNVHIGTGITFYASSGIISATGGFSGNIAGTASTASFATTSFNLSDAANIATGTINSARLSGSYNIDISGNATNVVGGIASVTNLSVSGISTFDSSVGIGTTNPTSKLYVVGDTFITGILTANRIVSNVYGEFTGGGVSGTNIVGTALSISGISTFSDTVYVGSGITFYASSGIVSATAFYGNGENLSDIIKAKLAGITLLDDGVQVGTPYQFSEINVVGNYVTASGVGSTATITFTTPPYADVAGIATYATNAGIATSVINNPGVGVATASGTVGTGATILDFRGSGISTVTVSAGIATINIIDTSGGLSLSDDTSTNSTYYVGIANTTTGTLSTLNVSSTKLTFNPSTGNLVAGGTVTANSDEKLKENIHTIENALDKVLSLRGVEYDRIDTGDKQIGVIAQEVEEIIPEVVYGDETKSVAYGNLVGLLIEAIKEQNKRIEELERKLGDG